MKDINKFIRIYKGFGIECKILNYDEADIYTYGKDIQVIVLKSDDSDEKLTGYTGFLTAIIFDKRGKFISQGFWE